MWDAFLGPLVVPLLVSLLALVLALLRSLGSGRGSPSLCRLVSQLNKDFGILVEIIDGLLLDLDLSKRGQSSDNERRRSQISGDVPMKNDDDVI